MDITKIAEKLVKMRKEKNLTQKEVADFIGVTQSTYAMYELGQRVPSDERKIKIAELYKKSVQSIFFAK